MVRYAVEFEVRVSLLPFAAYRFEGKSIWEGKTAW